MNSDSTSTDAAADREPGEVHQRLASASPSARAETGLRNADLRGASLKKADLRGKLLGGADLRNADMEGADLREADMANADLSGANLGEADLRGAMLEEADLSGANLRFAKLGGAVLEHAKLAGADLWGADLSESVLIDADLTGARLVESSLRGADLTRAKFAAATLSRVDLRDGLLCGADLRGAVLTGVDLAGASLKDAWLQEVELTGCDVTHVSLAGARLDGGRFERRQLGGSIGEERRGDFAEARKGYLVLERAFDQLGDHDAASWAYRRRRRMQKLESLRQARSAPDWRTAARSYAQYASDQFVEWLCDYGESIPRILGALLTLYIIFTLVYAVLGSVVREEETAAGLVKTVTRNPVDLAIFSLLAMSTGSIGVRLLPRDDLALALVGVHVFLGIALIGLLGFVLGNRIRR